MSQKIDDCHQCTHVCWYRIQLISKPKIPLNFKIRTATMIKKLFHTLSWYLWILPFIAFLGGYWACYFWITKSEISAPNIIGKNVHDGLALLSTQQLSLRIRAERDDPSFSPGTILDQFPKPDQQIKVNQTIYVTISKKPDPAIIPNMYGMTEQQIQTLCQKLGLEVESFTIPSHHPIQKCFAQYPLPSEQAHSKNIHVLIAAPQESLYLIPQLKGLPINQVKKSLEQANIVLEIFHEQTNVDHACKDCVVVNQRPTAGTVIKDAERLVLQLKVKNNKHNI